MQTRIGLGSAHITVMANAIMRAAKGLVRDFGEVEHLQVSHKGPAGFVSSADQRSEKILQEELRKARPTYGFILEESGEIAGEDPDYVWIVDPLDATTNFLHSLPHFAISVALQVKGEITAAVTYDPLRDEMFWADKGKGAFLNERRIRVSVRQQFKEALMVTCEHGIPVEGLEQHIQVLQQIGRSSAGLRRTGSASLDLAYVAAGRFDGFWQGYLPRWDMAAGLLLVREAGGRVTDYKGEDNMLASGQVVASNGFLHDTLRKMIVP